MEEPDSSCRQTFFVSYRHSATDPYAAQVAESLHSLGFSCALSPGEADNSERYGCIDESECMILIGDKDALCSDLLTSELRWALYQGIPVIIVGGINDATAKGVRVGPFIEGVKMAGAAFVPEDQDALAEGRLAPDICDEIAAIHSKWQQDYAGSRDSEAGPAEPAMPDGGLQYDYFISYKAQSALYADELHYQLRMNGLVCYLDRYSHRYGELCEVEVFAELERAIQASKMALIVGHHHLLDYRSQWVFFELRRFLRKQAPVLVVGGGVRDHLMDGTYIGPVVERLQSFGATQIREHPMKLTSSDPSPEVVRSIVQFSRQYRNGSFQQPRSLARRLRERLSRWIKGGNVS